MKVGKWEKEELTQLCVQLIEIKNGRKSIYRASIDLARILDRKYQSCYDKIQKVRRETREKEV